MHKLVMGLFNMHKMSAALWLHFYMRRNAHLQLLHAVGEPR
jgi:hypothetical protein